jgi:hypothetical protein
LFDLGADASVVGFSKGAEVEIRMYLRQELAEKHRLDAAKVFREVSGMECGTVWGYALFSGYRAKGDLRVLLDNIVEKFAELLGDVPQEE